jgi:hypothetical protein
MLDRPATEPVVLIRPRFLGPRFRERLRRGLWFLPLAILGLARKSLKEDLWIVGGVAVFAVIAYAHTALYVARSNLALVDDTIRRRSWLGRSATCSRTAVARVVEIRLRLTRLTGLGETWLLFVDEADRTLLRAYADYYPLEELARFSAALALPWRQVPGTATFAHARREFPGSFRWPWAHVWLVLLAVLVAGWLVAAIVIAAAG